LQRPAKDLSRRFTELFSTGDPVLAEHKGELLGIPATNKEVETKAS